MTLDTTVDTSASPPTDEEVVERVREGDRALYEVLVRRHNARLFRIVRPMVQDDDEAEDVMQEAYVRAFDHLGQFAGRARFGTWLARIAVHEALARAKRRARLGLFDPTDPREDGAAPLVVPGAPSGPQDVAARRELAALLETAVSALPESQRAVFVLRELGGLDTAETAESLELSPEAVKVRLHRARASLRADLERRLGESTRDIFAFHLERCDRVVGKVLARIART